MRGLVTKDKQQKAGGERRIRKEAKVIVRSVDS